MTMCTRISKLVNRIWNLTTRLIRRLMLLTPIVMMIFVIISMIQKPSAIYFNRTLYHMPKTITDLEEKLLGVKDTNDTIKIDYVMPWFMKGVRWPRQSVPQYKLFAEDAPGDDRIVNQLMYTHLKNKEGPIKKILLANGNFLSDTPSGREEFLRNKCPVDECSLTTDSREAATADAILFKTYFRNMYHKRHPKQIWILYFLESPYNTYQTLRSNKLINWTATYRRDSDIVTPYEKWIFYNSKIIQRDQNRNYADKKSKKVVWFVSNCFPNNNRMEYAIMLSQYINVDIIGACGNLKCSRDNPKCFRKLDKEYKFYLAFENCNCRDYITEKFFTNGLSHDVIPIVMGARPSEYAAVAPPNSYIHVEDFASPKELAAYLHKLDKNDTLYNSYFKWKGTGEFINTYFFCRVCAMLHASELRNRMSYYTNVDTWWRQGSCTKGEWNETRTSSPLIVIKNLN